MEDTRSHVTVRHGALILLASLFLAPLGAQASPQQPTAAPLHPMASSDGLWLVTKPVVPGSLPAASRIRPESGQALELNSEALDALLRTAPREGTQPVRDSTAVITLPRPDGGFERFAFVESPVMQPALQAQFPTLRSYLGQGIDDSRATVRFDTSLLGFRAQVLQPGGNESAGISAWYVDPVGDGRTRDYVSYSRGSQARESDTRCSTLHAESIPEALTLRETPATAGTPLQVLRNEYGIAIAATGEFSAGVAAAQTPPQSPSVLLTMSEIQTTLGRINQILERDGPVRLLLVAGNSQLIYLDPNTDPYDPTLSESALQQQFQNNINAVLGTTSYSLGHTFHWRSSGLLGNAGAIGSACNDSKKALAYSSTSKSYGDYFAIDLVAHEIGHQLGATHTFNGVAGSCSSLNGVPQWTASTAYEPGSGSTIMSYGGVCGVDNIVNYPPPSPPPVPPTANGAVVPMYNLSSMIQIANFVTGTTCVARIPTGNNHTGATPAVQGPYVIPSDTPFRLNSPSAEFGGPGDSLTYSIEEYDLGPQRSLGQDTGAGEPLLRVMPPSALSERYFPQFANVLSGTPSLGENLPRYSRNSSFRGVLRDNVAGAGGWGWGDINVQFVDVPLPGFKVTAPAGGGAFCGGSAMGVTWNVANTNQAPINAATVDILMSADGGQSFPFTLAADFPNAGAALLPVPSVPTTQARIKVQSSGGLFFNVNSGPFEVATGPPTIAVQPAPVSLCRFGTLTLSYTPGPGSPRHVQWYKNNAPIAGATSDSYQVTLADHSDSGDYKVVVTNGCGSVTSGTVRAQVGVTFDQLTPDANPPACQNVTLPSYARGVGAMTYQWIKDGLPLAADPRFTGVNGPTLALAGVRYEDEGGYWCRVQDQCEVQFSTTAAVTLPTPSWALRTTSGPIRRGFFDMAYDAARGVSVIYGGVHPDGQALGDTWEWDGLVWAQRSPAHSPGPRYEHQMTFDTARNATLLFSGYGQPPNAFNNSEVWSYDGNDWTQLTSSPGGPPPVVASQGDVAFDSARGKMVLLYESTGGTNTNPVNQTWEFDSGTKTWQMVSSGPGPEFFNSPIAFDALRGVTVGQYHWWANAPGEAKSWTSAGAGWSLIGTPAPDRYNPSMAYDAVRHRATTYACCRGQGPGFYRTDTNAWNGSQWEQVLPDITLSQQDAVIPQGMAFDTRRRAMVMTGWAYNDAYYAGLQTWEYRYLDRATFDRQPSGASPAPGQTVQFSAVAAGVPALAYQWRRGAANLIDGPGPGGSTISGATTPTLTITQVSGANGGAYQLAVTNACGVQVSAAADLTIAGGAGRVPGDVGSTGTPLTLTRSGGSLILNWGASCNAGDTDYEVYEGVMGAYSSHSPRACTTGGARSATFTPAAGNRYYLVVPRNSTREGSFGLDGNGAERPQGGAACLPQSLAVCH